MKDKLIEFEKEIEDINSQLDKLTMRKAKLLFSIKQLSNKTKSSLMRELIKLTPKDGGGIS
tara:strand:- start:12477 stop:12659 length:183 start_codon:yes stop_codon:yes gene_type:complete